MISVICSCPFPFLSPTSTSSRHSPGAPLLITLPVPVPSGGFQWLQHLRCFSEWTNGVNVWMSNPCTQHVCTAQIIWTQCIDCVTRLYVYLIAITKVSYNSIRWLLFLGGRKPDNPGQGATLHLHLCSTLSHKFNYANQDHSPKNTIFVSDLHLSLYVMFICYFCRCF